MEFSFIESLRSHWCTRLVIISAISSFCRMKQLGIFLLNLWREASALQGYTQNKICRYPLTAPGLREAISEKSALPKITVQSSRAGFELRFKHSLRAPNVRVHWDSSNHVIYDHLLDY